MTEASALATSGAPHGTVVLADEQTAGVGRLGRSWVSEAEAGVYCSILLRLNLKPANLPIASLVLGLATAEAIQKSTDVLCDLRWPNDVLVKERKVAGILAHFTAHRAFGARCARVEEEECIIAGIGINANQVSFPEGLRTPATSLRIESGGREQSRETIIVHLLESVNAFCSMLQSAGSDTILRAFTLASSYALHRRVVIEDTGEKGTTAGLDPNGFLLVKLDRGRLERVAAGGVRPDV
ncbi:MAG: biotin--[acetyl-CoA-carboxylase] ligase [Acidobacteriaceae bacterium]|nr:biotin--[acetyl-CoA-carboxylase] ligase [Acidobacteriaceae bacterium]